VISNLKGIRKKQKTKNKKQKTKNNNNNNSNKTLAERRNEPTNMGLKNQTLLKVCCQGHIPFPLFAASQSGLIRLMAFHRVSETFTIFYLNRPRETESDKVFVNL